MNHRRIYPSGSTWWVARTADHAGAGGLPSVSGLSARHDGGQAESQEAGFYFWGLGLKLMGVGGEPEFGD